MLQVSFKFIFFLLFLELSFGWLAVRHHTSYFINSPKRNSININDHRHHSLHQRVNLNVLASSFSLDQSIVPKGIFSKGISSTLLIVAISGIFAILKSVFGTIDTTNGIFGKLNDSIFPGMRLCLLVLTAKFRIFFESIQSYISEMFFMDPPEEIDLRDWQICSLSERESLPGRYVKYRFELDNPNCILPLEVGQEVFFYLLYATCFGYSLILFIIFTSYCFVQ